MNTIVLDLVLIFSFGLMVACWVPGDEDES